MIHYLIENEDKLFALAKLIFPPVIEHPSVDFDMLNGVGEIEPDSDDDGYFENKTEVESS
jgi:hypothetical protein